MQSRRGVRTIGALGVARVIGCFVGALVGFALAGPAMWFALAISLGVPALAALAGALGAASTPLGSSSPGTRASKSDLTNVSSGTPRSNLARRDGLRGVEEAVLI
jgi:hypothetical protein